MINDLKNLLENAYAPYSKYRVVAIVVMKDGSVFKGVNVENASYGGTICAERNALNAAISNGYKNGDFKELHIMNASDKIGYPCFICRQSISELCDSDMKITLYTVTGKKIEVPYGDIVVNPFTGDDIK
ncbi:MAG TPA: cytidine deaminase [Mollicutes bacterium]|nr:cytidine deaminase [Mollicutes bacterium]